MEITDAACDFIRIWSVSTSRGSFPDHLWKFALRNLPTWQSPRSPTNAHIYRNLWLTMCEIYQRCVEPFGPRLQIASQWCAHHAAAQAQCNHSEEQYQQRRSNKLPSQHRQASGSIKTFLLCTLYTTTSWLQHQSLQQFQHLMWGYRHYTRRFQALAYSILYGICFMHILYDGNNLIIFILLLCRIHKLLTNRRGKKQHAAVSCKHATR